MVTKLSSLEYICVTHVASENMTANWPVQERTRAALERAASMHYVNPLPAFDKNHMVIPPSNYHKKLCGAIVQAHFGLIHYFIKQDKKNVFTAVVHEIIVLRPPPAAPVNPLKRGRLANGPYMSQLKKPCNVGVLSFRAPHDYSLHPTDLIVALHQNRAPQ